MVLRTGIRPTAVRGRPEAELLLCCARTCLDPGTEERIEALLGWPLDWEDLLRTARRHKLVPLLYRNLCATGPEAVPPDVLQRLRESAREVAERNADLTGELLAVLRLLESHGIRAVPFKGPVLATLAYGDLSLRQFSDLDLLVPEGDVLAAQRLICTRGYGVLVHEFVDPDHLDHRLTGPRDVPSFARYRLDYDSVLWLPGPRVWLELHWRLFPWYYTAPPCDADATSAACLAGAQVRTFPVEELLLLLCLHGAKHHWQRLGWVCDVAELLRAHPDLDWRSVMERAAGLGGRRMLALGLFLAGDLLAADLPAEVREWVYADPAVPRLAGPVRRRLLGEGVGSPEAPRRPLPLVGHTPGDILFHLRTKEHVRDRIRYLFGMMVGLTLEALRADRLGERFRHCLRLAGRTGSRLIRLLCGKR